MNSMMGSLRVAHFLTARDCIEAFGYFDADDTGSLEFPEVQGALNTMLAPAEVNISSWNGVSFTPSSFRTLVEQMHNKYPQYNVAGNLMKFIKENREAAEDDAEPLPEKAVKKVFDAYDEDGSGELAVIEIIKLFVYLKIPLTSLFEEDGALEGTKTFDDFLALIRSVNEKHPDLDIDDKIMDVAGNLGSGKPDLSEVEEVGDPESDPAAQEDPEDEPPNKKALLVGINYVGSSCELGGCINDSRNQMQVLIDHYGFSEDNILLLTEDQDDDSKLPNAQTIRDGISWLLDGAGEGDFLFFAYSGHGSQLPDREGSEPDGKNEILCPLDLQDDWHANSIADNYLYDVFYNQLPDGVKCLCVYDCCHSGTMSDLSCTRDLTPPGDDVGVDGDHAGRFLEPAQEILDEIESAASSARDGGIEERPTRDMDVSGKLVWTISGCQDNQTSADATIGGQRQGAMTWALLEALQEGGTKGPWCYHYDNLLTTMRKKLAAKRFSQIPAMATTIDENFTRYYMAKQTPE